MLESEGFKQVHKSSFMGRKWRELKWHTQPEEYHIYWRSPVLVSFDSHEAIWVNGGYVWYNWLPTKSEDVRQLQGYWKDRLWVGHHDCRYGFQDKLHILEQNGVLVCPWVEHNDLWLVNYMERYQENLDVAVTNKTKIATMPEDVGRCISA